MRRLVVASCIAFAAGAAGAQDKPLVAGVDGTFAPTPCPSSAAGWRASTST